MAGLHFIPFRIPVILQSFGLNLFAETNISFTQPPNCNGNKRQSLQQHDT